MYWTDSVGLGDTLGGYVNNSYDWVTGPDGPGPDSFSFVMPGGNDEGEPVIGAFEGYWGFNGWGNRGHNIWSSSYSLIVGNFVKSSYFAGGQGAWIAFDPASLVRTGAPDFKTQAYRAILGILRSSPLITTIVNAQNIIDATSQQYQTLDPEKAHPQAGDLPELMLMSGRFSSKLEGGNSLQSLAVQTYVLWVTTDTPEIGGESGGQTVTMNSLAQAIDFTLAATDEQLGLPFVLTRELRGGPDLKDSDKKNAPNRGVKRWAAVYAIDVQFSFARAALNQFVGAA
jgi:hypothetical protein